jgi:hypothetical protein
LARRLYNLAHWWHLLSLDAPTVAILWSWSFARAMRLPIPFAGPFILGLVTWLLYVADRILDGLVVKQPELLRERHRFHARHRRLFLSTALVLGAFSLWMIVTRMYARALQDDLFLSIFAVLYLGLVHAGKYFSRSNRCDWLPKELAVGALFAAATAVPAWSRLSVFSALTRSWLAEAVILFAVLCWTNCVAIEKWETVQWQAAGVHPTTQWAGEHLREVALGLAAASTAAAWLAPTRGLTAVFLAALSSSIILILLDGERTRLSPLTLRVAADAALLTPLAFFPVLR